MLILKRDASLFKIRENLKYSEYQVEGGHTQTSSSFEVREKEENRVPTLHFEQMVEC